MARARSHPPTLTPSIPPEAGRKCSLRCASRSRPRRRAVHWLAARRECCPSVLACSVRYCSRVRGPAGGQEGAEAGVRRGVACCTMSIAAPSRDVLLFGGATVSGARCSRRYLAA
jgi:hypothetical protein